MVQNLLLSIIPFHYNIPVPKEDASQFLKESLFCPPLPEGTRLLKILELSPHYPYHRLEGRLMATQFG